jgi:hypothetical protein
MRSEYDETALTLMRAIKAGVDPKGIMNPGTLLPPPHGIILTPRTATIELENIAGWVIKPENLSAPAEADPGKESEKSWFNSVLGDVPRLGKGEESRNEQSVTRLEKDQDVVNEVEELPKEEGEKE